MADRPELKVSLLGALSITHDGRPVTGFASNKVQALLCYLAFTARPHSRDTLIGLLWSDMSDTDARTNLRQALTNLRRLVGDHLRIDRDTVEFDRASSYWLDAEEFEKLTADHQPTTDETAVSHRRSAVDLYRGDLLEGFFVRAAPEFEEWLLAQRERFRQQALQVFHTLLDYYLKHHEYARGIDYATRLLALDPWREEAHRALMLLYARNGQRGAALAQYETCRRILVEKIGVEPSAETRALYERIRATDTTKPNLPPQATTFVGRENELAQIDALLLKPECSLITLLGQGGIGKTRLALAAAAKQAGAFLNGIYFVPLAAITTIDLIPVTIADTLQIPLTAKSTPQTQVVDYLRDKETLLVLDNFEQLVDGAKMLADILNAARDVKMIVTSRERLNLQCEWIVAVDGLPVPSGERSPRRSSAIELFLHSAGRIQPRLTPNDDEMASIVRICQLVYGVPLGIELAAGAVMAQSCREIARAIENDVSVLATTQRDVPERQRSLRAVFEHSWNLLKPEEQRVLRGVSIFRGGFTLEAAGAIIGSEYSPQHLLAALLDKSLLRRDPNERYDLHELVRQFAEEKLSRQNEQSIIALKHAEYFLEFAKRAKVEMVGANQTRWFSLVDAEQSNLRTAMTWALANERAGLAAQMSGAIWNFWNTRGYINEGRQWLTQTAQAAQHANLDPEIWLDALNGAANMANTQGDYAQARTMHSECLAIRRTLGKPRPIAVSLNNLANVVENLGDYVQAIELYSESLGIFRELGNPNYIAGSLTNLGNSYMHLGDFARAIKHQEEALALHRVAQDQFSSAIALVNLADALYFAGEYTRVIELCEECIALHQAMGNENSTAFARLTLGRALLAQNQIERAEILFKQSLERFQAMGDKNAMTKSIERLAETESAKENFARAAQLLGAVETARQRQGNPRAPIERANYEVLVAQLRAQLGVEEFEVSFAEGETMVFAQWVAPLAT